MLNINLPVLQHQYIRLYNTEEEYNNDKTRPQEICYSDIKDNNITEDDAKEYQYSIRTTNNDNLIKGKYYDTDDIRLDAGLEIVWGYFGWRWTDFELNGEILKGGNFVQSRAMNTVKYIVDSNRLQHINDFLKYVPNVKKIEEFDISTIKSASYLCNIEDRTMAFTVPAFLFNLNNIINTNDTLFYFNSSNVNIICEAEILQLHNIVVLNHPIFNAGNSGIKGITKIEFGKLTNWIDEINYVLYPCTKNIINKQLTSEIEKAIVNNTDIISGIENVVFNYDNDDNVIKYPIYANSITNIKPINFVDNKWNGYFNFLNGIGDYELNIDLSVPLHTYRYFFNCYFSIQGNIYITVKNITPENKCYVKSQNFYLIYKSDYNINDAIIQKFDIGEQDDNNKTYLNYNSDNLFEFENSYPTLHIVSTFNNFLFNFTKASIDLYIKYINTSVINLYYKNGANNNINIDITIETDNQDISSNTINFVNQDFLYNTFSLNCPHLNNNKPLYVYANYITLRNLSNDIIIKDGIYANIYTNSDNVTIDCNLSNNTSSINNNVKNIIFGENCVSVWYFEITVLNIETITITNTMYYENLKIDKITDITKKDIFYNMIYTKCDNRSKTLYINTVLYNSYTDEERNNIISKWESINIITNG